MELDSRRWETKLPTFPICVLHILHEGLCLRPIMENTIPIKQWPQYCNIWQPMPNEARRFLHSNFPPASALIIVTSSALARIRSTESEICWACVLRSRKEASRSFSLSKVFDMEGNDEKLGLTSTLSHKPWCFLMQSLWRGRSVWKVGSFPWLSQSIWLWDDLFPPSKCSWSISSVPFRN